MIYRITWADHFRAFWGRVPHWAQVGIRFIALVVALLVMLAALALSTGCGETLPSPPTIASPPVLGPPTPAPGSLAAKDQELAAAVGTVARLTHERDDLRIAPLRTSLAWVDGVSLVAMLACVGLAVASLFWGLGFTWKIPAGLAIGFAGVLATSLATSWALGHVAWIVGAVLALGAGAALWAIRRHLSLADAAKQAWNGVPDTVNLSARAENLLGRLK